MDVFGAVADPTRRALLARLAGAPARVVDLASEHDMSRPAVSKHLRILGEVGLVRAEPLGRERHYTLDPAPLTQVREFLAAVDAALGAAEAQQPSTGAPTPPVSEELLDGLDLEVRRVGRDRRRSPAPAPHTREDTA